MKLTWLRRLSWQTLLAGITAGGIIHICATFGIPYFSTTSAYKTLTAALPLNQLSIAPLATPETQLLPFMTPGIRYALCRYSIHRSPIRITARLLDPSWTLALYTARGDNFFVATGLVSKRVDIAFNLVPPAPRFLGIFSLSRNIATDQTKIPVPEKSGLMVIRAPIQGTAYGKEIDEALKLASCRPVFE